MSWTEVALRRTGALAAAAAFTALPAAEARKDVVLALHAMMLIGCAAVQLSPAHRAVPDLARRAAEAARRTMALGASAAGLRCVGFAGILLYVLYVAGDARTEPAAADMVRGFLLFLMFLAGVWAVYLSMVTEKGVRLPRRVAALALTRLPAAEHVVLTPHTVFLLGGAAVLHSPAHRAVADLAWRAEEAARGMALAASAAGLRWVGFAGIVLYALYAASDVRMEEAAAEASLDKVRGFLLFLMFLAGIWAVYLSMATGRGAPPLRPAATAEEDIDGGEVDDMAPQPERVLLDSKL